MKRLGGIALLGALAIAGCSAQTPEAEPAPTPTEDASTFIEDVRATGEYVGVPDENLRSIGDSVCGALLDGSKPDDVKYFLGVGGLEPNDAEVVFLASVEEFCPELN